MPNALLYECFSGIAGDMHLGGMLDLGMPKDHILGELSKLGLDDEFRIRIEPKKKMGIAGTHVFVELTKQRAHARRLPQIQAIINHSALAPGVKSRALAMFELLAQAEAKVHDIPLDQVHFHEVGAVDAIVDIVGAAIALEYLNSPSVYCNSVELGSGMVKCAHGLLPVPAPATALLLEGYPTTRGHVEGEATTPTGATILAHAVDHWQQPHTFIATKHAYGVGRKDFVRPNVVRMSLGKIEVAVESETNTYIECNIDDMSPEAFEPLTERLFDLGVKDVYFTPITMKKSRPATKLSVIAADTHKDSAIECIMQHSSSIGVRAWPVNKTMLSRSVKPFVTPLGQVRVKIVQLPDGSKRWKAEHDDIREIARQRELSYLAVRSTIDRSIAEQLH